MFANNLFPRLRASTKKAFQRVHKVSGTETDADLALYNTLQPEHFVELMKEYGEADIVGYIREMETRRIMGRKK